MAASTALPPCFIASSAASTARLSAADTMARPSSRHWAGGVTGFVVRETVGADWFCSAAVHAESVAARAMTEAAAKVVRRIGSAPSCAGRNGPSYRQRSYTGRRRPQLHRRFRLVKQGPCISGPGTGLARMTARRGPLNLITDVGGLTVGSAHDADAATGVTVIRPGARAVAAVAVGGGGPGTRETDALGPDTLVDAVDAIVFSGGSVYGLAA